MCRRHDADYLANLGCYDDAGAFWTGPSMVAVKRYQPESMQLLTPYDYRE